ncbi:MAG: hypothetical protein HKM98_00750, partial [Gammaproteobacteria bacterium]|nr:hypothetical protein [Gammaproteobacteria bacterium]
MPEDPGRRQFLQLAGSVAGSGWVSGQWPALLAIGTTACVARDKAENFSHLKPDVAADLAAVAALIIPSDDTPGATEAGVIYFIDGAFDSVMR